MKVGHGARKIRESLVFRRESIALRFGQQSAQCFRLPPADLFQEIARPFPLLDPKVAITPGNLADFDTAVHDGFTCYESPLEQIVDEIFWAEYHAGGTGCLHLGGDSGVKLPYLSPDHREQPGV